MTLIYPIIIIQTIATDWEDTLTCVKGCGSILDIVAIRDEGGSACGYVYSKELDKE